VWRGDAEAAGQWVSLLFISPLERIGRDGFRVSGLGVERPNLRLALRVRRPRFARC
jgi:hypothetical protein